MFEESNGVVRFDLDPYVKVIAIFFSSALSFAQAKISGGNR